MTAIAIGPSRNDPIRRRFEQAAERFIDASARSDQEIAALLRTLETDIAIDLMGYTNGSRFGIFAHRPAPVQLGYFGYSGTVGSRHLDYILADPCVVPQAQRRHYAEQVIELPPSFLPSDPSWQLPAAAPSRAALGLPESGFVFCSFNNVYKITPEMFEIWLRLLLAVPGSVLWLLEDNDAATVNLQHFAAARGIAPDRLVFAPRVALADHLARHGAADLFLDTLPYNAHTTARDALWTGLPVLTCPGSGFAARVAASLLTAAGLPELIARDLAAYESTALALAESPERLAALKARLARNRTTMPLFDGERQCRHVEQAFATIWARAERGAVPTAFAVTPIDG